jgi:hypothetical protein
MQMNTKKQLALIAQDAFWYAHECVTNSGNGTFPKMSRASLCAAAARKFRELGIRLSTHPRRSTLGKVAFCNEMLVDLTRWCASQGINPMTGEEEQV